MAISSNPLSSTRKSARAALGSRRPQSLDYLGGGLPSRAPSAWLAPAPPCANRDNRPFLLGERGLDVLEGARFAALASRWWPLRPIHPVRRCGAAIDG